jgi:hypothetical protein
MNVHAETVDGFTVKDSGISTGIVYERDCTDKGCWILFIVTLCAMIGVIIYGVSAGEWEKWSAPYDASGNLCGYGVDDQNRLDYITHKYLYLIDFMKEGISAKEALATGVCVVKCPGNTDMYNPTT